MTIDGRVFTYTVPPSTDGAGHVLIPETQRNLHYIEDGFRTQINAANTAGNFALAARFVTVGTTEFLEIYDPAKVAGIPAAQAGDDPFTLGVSKGGSQVQALFDIDHAVPVIGTISVPVVVPYYLDFFGFRIQIGWQTVFDTLQYTISPMLELIDEAGVVRATSIGNTHGFADAGSSSLNDPFLEKTFP